MTWYGSCMIEPDTATRYAVIDPVLGSNEEKSTVALLLDSPSVVPLAEASVPSENRAMKGRGALTVMSNPEYEKDRLLAPTKPGVWSAEVISSRESETSPADALS